MSSDTRPDASRRASDALDAVIPYLACPICGGELARAGMVLRCGPGHSFNIARQGYASLVSGGPRTSPGDDAEMVAARERFLATGHYAPIADAVASSVASVEGLCVDVAGGTGYYLARVLDRRQRMLGLGLDLSPYAARRAARAHPRQAAVTADAWSTLPLRDGAVASVLSVFGPRNPAELLRVLAPGGELVLATPTAEHLVELRRALRLIEVDERKGERLERQLARFERVDGTTVQYRVGLSPQDIFDDVRMGPNAHHTDAEALLEQVHALGPTTVTVSVTVSRYRARNDG